MGHWDACSVLAGTEIGPVDLQFGLSSSALGNVQYHCSTRSLSTLALLKLSLSDGEFPPHILLLSKFAALLIFSLALTSLCVRHLEMCW
jgi:hypothetical protein